MCESAELSVSVGNSVLIQTIASVDVQGVLEARDPESHAIVVSRGKTLWWVNDHAIKHIDGLSFGYRQARESKIGFCFQMKQIKSSTKMNKTYRRCCMKTVAGF